MLKVLDKVQNSMLNTMAKRVQLIKNEDIAYVGAFLCVLRNKLLPYHSKSLKHYPQQDEIDKFYKETFDEIKNLYIDEQWTLLNSDLIEQSYYVFHEIHNLVRKYDVVYNMKLEENRKKFFSNNPDLFPIYDLSYEGNLPEHKTIWEMYPNFKEELEEKLGFFLIKKASNIEHSEAGDGVFLSAKKRRFILPGTLLGFYPGVVFARNIPNPPLEVNTVIPFLKRYDGSWLDPTHKIPFPFDHSLSLDEWYEKESEALKRFARNDFLHEEIPINMLNPFALGNFINHPPPETEANVKFVDFEIPFNFFPSDYLRYFPYVMNSYNKAADKFHKKGYRGVAIVSLKEIQHEEELYINYLEEALVPNIYKPDWLLEPPPRNPYLIKDQFVHEPNFIDEAMQKVYFLTYEKNNTEFKNYISREKEFNILSANNHIKMLQTNIRAQEQKQLPSDKEEVKKIETDNDKIKI